MLGGSAVAAAAVLLPLSDKRGKTGGPSSQLLQDVQLTSRRKVGVERETGGKEVDGEGDVT